MTAPRVGILKTPVSEPRGLINSIGQRPLCAMEPERKMVGGGLSAPPTGASDWTFYNCLIYSYDPINCALKKKASIVQEGDVVIAVMLPLYIWQRKINATGHYQNVKRFKAKTYLVFLSFLFAIEEINRNPHILPNITLGFDVHNVAFIDADIMYVSLKWLSGIDRMIPNYNCRKEQKSVIVFTGPSWTTSALIGSLLELYKFPQVTFGRHDPILSGNIHLTSLYQMAPKDTFLAHAMISLLIHFRWNWVGLYISEDERSIQFWSDFRTEMDKNSICVAFVEIISISELSVSPNSWSYHHQILKSSVNVIIVYFDSDSLITFFYMVERFLMTHKVWVMASPYHSSKIQWSIFLHPFHGSLMFSHHHKEISGFRKFIHTINPSKYPNDIYLAILWFFFFACSFSKYDCTILENCPLNSSLEMLPYPVIDMAISEESYNLYNAVYAVAHILHEILLHQVEFQGLGGVKELIHFPWKLHFFIRNIQSYHLDSNQLILDEKRKSAAEYDILNYCHFPTNFVHILKVGKFSSFALLGQQLSIHEDMIEWALGFTETPQSLCSESCHPGFRKSHVEGKTICCFDCTPCPENEISNETNMEQCLRCGVNQYANTQRIHCINKSVTFLSYEDTLGMILTSLSLCFSGLTVSVLGVFVKHRATPIVKANNLTLSYILLISLTFCFLSSLIFIGHPNTATCILQQIVFAVVFTVAISTVLAKTVTVVLAFRVTSPGRKMRWFLISRVPNFIVPICTLILLVPFGIWLGTSPPFIDIDERSEYDHIIIVCNKGSVTAFYCVLGYLGCLAMGSFTLAFLVRNLPDTFNEAKLITFSMLVFCSVWVTFLPVYQSTRGKSVVATEVFSILASGAGLLGCIFLPKCYIILLRPERIYSYQCRNKKCFGTKMSSEN
ncbi:vomeronasal type-2 receptor 116-like [Peromyscus maniculatus bairdii]|uniref:vomeronasal type-2 receptor 116-like n=1 Tax=Peromyscus maniculatus bairdii TaxID=230844 RepID=UPI003FD1742C